MATALHKIGALLCVVLHESAMWPINGEYQCRTCGRRHPVPWAPHGIVPRVVSVTVAKRISLPPKNDNAADVSA